MKRMVLALTALVCLVAFTLPSVARAESPPTDTQLCQDYQENITANAEHQPIIAATAENSEVDIGVPAVFGEPLFGECLFGGVGKYDHSMAVERAARTTNPHSLIVANYSNERTQPENMAAKHYMRRARDASRQLRHVARE